MDINVRIAGEAGQGIETAGEVLAQALADAGLYVFAAKSYMSRIRGGLNWYDIRISDQALFSGKENSDILLSLTAEGIKTLQGKAGSQAVVIADKATAENSSGCNCLDISGTAKTAGGSKIMANMVAAGVVFGMLPYDIEALSQQIRQAFDSKGEEMVKKNLKCAESGAELTKGLSDKLLFPQSGGADSFLCSGTEAVGMGALSAGVKFASAYPMTPATGVITYLAKHAREYGIVVEQAEDEIAAVNMVCGATFAGACALTATSGGGFALMAEGLSLSGMMELPVFIVLSQRPGPATGLPTRTAQQDLRFAVHGGHGEFPRAIFAPGTPEEAFKLTRKALATAHTFQSPAILMMDQFLADYVTNTAPLNTAYRPIDKQITTSPGEDYRRYKITENGVSPRAVPGGDALVKADSDEHDAEGHITENLSIRIEQHDKRMRKEKGIIEDSIAPMRYGPQDAQELIINWGSSYGPCREAVDTLNERGHGIAMLHFAQVWPLKTEEIKKAIQGDAPSWPELTCVEGNSTAQFAGLLKEQGIIDSRKPLLKYNGMPFTGIEIAEAIESD